MVRVSSKVSDKALQNLTKLCPIEKDKIPPYMQAGWANGYEVGLKKGIWHGEHGAYKYILSLHENEIKTKVKKMLEHLEAKE